MTHEELLIKISDLGDNCLGIMAGAKMSDALRAVVELHSPVGVICGWCTCHEDNHIVEYPCKTIQAIEKELG